MIVLEDALSSWVLDDYPYAVISKEKLSEQIYIYYIDKKYKGERIGLIRKAAASSSDYEKTISRLEIAGVLMNLNSTKSDYEIYSQNIQDNIYQIKGKPEYSPQEAACAIYPYGYVSKINAMVWHGLTDKIPKVVRFTSCTLPEWKKRSIADIKIDPKNLFEPMHFIPRYPRKTTIFGPELIPSTETSYTEPVSIRNSPLRVSSVAKTFIDMLRYPDECGGIDHVLDIYKESGKKFSKQIINELKKTSTRKIDIARTGFVLQKIVGLQDPQLSSWQEESKKTRGSSKILVPGEPFSAIFDEDWSLSLNAESAQRYGN